MKAAGYPEDREYSLFPKFSLWAFAIIFITSCSSPTPYDQIESLEVRSILERGINQSGGLAAWHSSPGYQFKKRSILYLEDGSIESKNTQVVQFKDYPNLEGSIIWKNASDTVRTRIEYKDGKAIKYINDIDQGEVANEEARKSFLGAHIVMSMPFKLLDLGVELTYGGEQEQYGKTVKVLIADYNSENPNHTESHRWWHYFDASTYDYLGYKVFHPPTYAHVENLRTTSANGGITFPVDRITWRVDSLDNKQFIRAKFAYSEFESLGK